MSTDLTHAGKCRRLADIVHSSRLSLEVAVARLLEADGWKHTSQTPDSCWRWQKRIGNRMWALHEDEALKLAMGRWLDTGAPEDQG